MAAKKIHHAIVRGMTSKYFLEHFKEMKVHFGGKYGKPAYDSDYIGYYIEAPVSAVTHVGIVEKIERKDDDIVFFLKAVVKLDKPIKVSDHAVRKHEYWPLERLGIDKIGMTFNKFTKVDSTG